MSGLTPDINNRESREITKEVRIKMELAIYRFDFSRVERIMKFLKWSWAEDNGGLSIPDIDKLRDTAYRLLEEAYTGGTGYCASGGFVARYKDDDFELAFCVEESDSYVDE